jgi:hypothetical protein
MGLIEKFCKAGKILNFIFLINFENFQGVKLFQHLIPVK